MEDTLLIIKYNDKYFIELNKNKYGFIYVPSYYKDNNCGNVTIFLNIFLNGILNNDFGSKVSYTNDEFSTLDTIEYIPLGEELQIGNNIFLYDVDKLLLDCTYPNELKEIMDNAIANLPTNIKYMSYEELLNLNSNKKINDNYDDVTNYSDYQVVDEKLLITLRKQQIKKDKEVLLLYSGGKDSTLSAYRLNKYGFHVSFVHYCNGYNLDEDKPYLTYYNLFFLHDGFSFDYQLSKMSVEKCFNELMEYYGDADIQDGTLSSEICCLCCRSAMYLKTIELAIKNNIKYIADGARISQQFFLESVPMIKEYQELCKMAGITLLCPVLTLDDDSILKQELILYGSSSKTWESKCLLGKKPMNKTSEDEKIIMDYYCTYIKPYMIKNINKMMNIKNSQLILKV